MKCLAALALLVSSLVVSAGCTSHGLTGASAPADAAPDAGAAADAAPDAGPDAAADLAPAADATVDAAPDATADAAPDATADAAPKPFCPTGKVLCGDSCEDCCRDRDCQVDGGSTAVCTSNKCEIRCTTPGSIECHSMCVPLEGICLVDILDIGGADCTLESFKFCSQLPDRPDCSRIMRKVHVPSNDPTQLLLLCESKFAQLKAEVCALGPYSGERVGLTVHTYKPDGSFLANPTARVERCP
jgi:hypothetical protein